LYQIRSTLNAFNDHLNNCLIPGKYLVIDETMNQWLGVGMPNLKKVPRKPHPIGQEFKSVADYHTNCIIRLDTVSDPCVKEFDNEEGMRTLTATVKRLTKPSEKRFILCTSSIVTLHWGFRIISVGYRETFIAPIYRVWKWSNCDC
jgi:hypothetical protein